MCKVCIISTSSGVNMSLQSLESNLHELFAVGHAKRKTFIADISGTYIYSTQTGWGIFWSWVFDIANLLGFDDLKKNCFEKAMAHTHQLFKTHLGEVIEASKSYQSNLNKKYTGLAKIANVSSERYLISRWKRTVAPFTKYMRAGVHAEISNVISIGFNRACSLDYKIPFSVGNYTAQIKHLHNIIRLEGILKSELPFNILYKVAMNLPIDKSEQKALNKFVKKLNRNENNIEVNFLHKTLITILADRKKNDTENHGITPSITTLELALVNLNCSIFLQKDPKHIAKNEQFKTGDRILCNGRELVLGERLGEDKLDDHNIIFATDDPEIVLSIGINAVLHSLKRQIANEESWGIKPAAYIDVDEANGNALIEKLFNPLGSHQWTSKSDQIDSNDEKVATPLWKLLKWLIKQNKTPLNFSPKYLMFDRQGYLKCLKVALKGDFDFNALEQFAFECSGGNRYIYRYLMEKSQLRSHPIAGYYAEMVAYTLKGEKYDAADVAATMGIIDKRIVQRGRDLVLEVKEMKELACVKIKGLGTKESAVEIDKRVSDELLASYKTSGAAGMLPIS